VIKETEETKEVTVIHKHRYCDDCGIELKKRTYSGDAKCVICEKDLCKSCVGHEEWSGDYETLYCAKCWNIGEQYRIKIESLEYEIEKLNVEWLNECRK